VPQVPQFAAADRVSVSHPSDGSRLQSANGASHRPTAHRLETHDAAPFCTTHAFVQLPQCAGSLPGSTQPPLQHTAPIAHPRVASHPGTQACATQRVPTAQWASSTHCTHAWVVGSQCAVAAPASRAPASRVGEAHASSVAQPAAQVLLDAQNRPAPQTSRAAVQATHVPLTRSQIGRSWLFAAHCPSSVHATVSIGIAPSAPCASPVATSGARPRSFEASPPSGASAAASAAVGCSNWSQSHVHPLESSAANTIARAISRRIKTNPPRRAPTRQTTPRPAASPANDRAQRAQPQRRPPRFRDRARHPRRSETCGRHRRPKPESSCNRSPRIAA